MILRAIVSVTRKFWYTGALTVALVVGVAAIYRRQTFLQDTTTKTLEQYARQKRRGIQAYKGYLDLPANVRHHWEQFVRLPRHELQAYYRMYPDELAAGAKAIGALNL